MNIFFAIDKNYLPYLYISINSILQSASSDDKFHFYVMQNDFTDYEKSVIAKLQKIKPFEIVYLNIDEDLLNKCRREDYRLTLTTYYRYLVADLVPEIDKALYLDVDIMVKNSLSEFWSIDLGDSYVAGVPDFNYIKPNEHKVAIGLKENSTYFNAGILLMNLKAFSQHNLSQKLIDVSVENIEKFRLADQDALNVAFEGNIKEIDCKFNYQSQHLINATEMFREEVDIVIEHHAGYDKKLFYSWKFLKGYPLKLKLKAIRMYYKSWPKLFEIYCKQKKSKLVRFVRNLPIIGITLKKIKDLIRGIN